MTQHRNWVETAPDRFEACIESDLWPVKIELDEVGAAFTFRRKAAGCWSFLSGRTRRAPYRTISIDPAGCLMVEIQAAVLPPGRPPTKDGTTPPKISYRVIFPGNAPDYNDPLPDLDPPK